MIYFRLKTIFRPLLNKIKIPSVNLEQTRRLPTRFTKTVAINVPMSLNKSNEMRNVTIHQYVDEEFKLRARMFAKISSFENAPKAFDGRVGVNYGDLKQVRMV